MPKPFDRKETTMISRGAYIYIYIYIYISPTILFRSRKFDRYGEVSLVVSGQTKRLNNELGREKAADEMKYKSVT